MKTSILCGALLLLGCGGEPSGSDDAGGGPPSVLGNWESMVDTVRITASFSGTADAGTFETAQSVTIEGDLDTCRSDSVGSGDFVVDGSSITLTVTAGVQRTRGCSFPDTDTPVTDLTTFQSFADALSGPFVVTETTLQLGASYPEMTRF